MSPEQICSRIARDLDYLAIELIHAGRRGPAQDVLRMLSTLYGELFAETEESPMQAVQALSAAAADGGAA